MFPPLCARSSSRCSDGVPATALVYASSSQRLRLVSDDSATTAIPHEIPTTITIA